MGILGIVGLVILKIGMVLFALLCLGFTFGALAAQSIRSTLNA